MFAPLKRQFDFQGRSRRAEYWPPYLLTPLVTKGLDLPMIVLAMESETGEPNAVVGLVGAFLGLVWLGFFPSKAITIRRLDDTSRSGWWVLISFLPLAGALVLSIFVLLRGTAGPDPSGADPNGENSAEVSS